MKVRTKLIVLILFVALVPFSISAVTSLRLHQRAVIESLTALHEGTALGGATIARSRLDGAVHNLRQLITESIQWPELSEQERQGALWLVYGQLDDIVIASLLDSTGQGVGVSAYFDDTTPEGRASKHPKATSAVLERFAQSLPFESAKREGFALGEPFATDGGVAVPIAFRMAGDRAGRPWVLIVALSLRGLCDELARAQPGHTQIHLIDHRARRLCAATEAESLALMDASLVATAETEGVRTARYLAGGQPPQEMLASSAASGAGWTVVAEQPVAAALAPSRDMGQRTVFWLVVSALAALLAGFYLSRSISRPLAQLAAGTDRVAQGSFDVRLSEDGRDEFAQVAGAFNQMCVEIDKRNAELERWNEELQMRVDERTRELQEAQQLLLESRKQAAMATLGAGFAHEINNPLAGMLGLTQILLASAKEKNVEDDVEMLTSIEQEAQRIHRIVKRVLALSQANQRRLKSVAPNELVDEALAAATEALEARNVEVTRKLGPDVPAIAADRQQLLEALAQLIDNASKAIGQDGGNIEVRTAAIGGELCKISISDDGRGIAPENLGRIFEPFFTTKEGDWRGEGLGLAMVHRAVEAHHGTVKVDSTEGEGTTITVTLPVAKQAAHLV